MHNFRHRVAKCIRLQWQRLHRHDVQLHLAGDRIVLVLAQIYRYSRQLYSGVLSHRCLDIHNRGALQRDRLELRSQRRRQPV